MRKKRNLFLLLILLFTIYMIGPSPEAPNFDFDPAPTKLNLIQLEDSINFSESNNPLVKEDNQARIVWADNNKEKTDVAIVYLHGYSASQGEGSPIHRMIAEKFHCNLYLARMNDHGLNKEEALLDMKAEKLYEDAVKAIEIGKQIGNEVIVMSTSTGGTLALLYASKHDDLKALINYSPNVRIRQKLAYFLDKPWGLNLAQIYFQSKYRGGECSEYEARYWDCKARLESIVELQNLVGHSMTEETFSKVKIPVFNGYYYKDKKNRDRTVSTDAIEWMHENLGTPDGSKVLRSFPDAGVHVIANEKFSEAWMEVFDESCEFLESIVGMQPLKTSSNLLSN